MRVSRSITLRVEAEIQETSKQIYCPLALWYSICNWLANVDQGTACTTREMHINKWAVRYADIEENCLTRLSPTVVYTSIIWYIVYQDLPSFYRFNLKCKDTVRTFE